MAEPSRSPVYMGVETFEFILKLNLASEQVIELCECLSADQQALLRLYLPAPEPQRQLTEYEVRKRANDRERRRQYTALNWPALREEVFARDGYRCVYCDADLLDQEPHCDHVVPFSRGGTHTLDNLVTSCAACNIAKGDRTPEEWKAGQ
jgi:5-methylcytosine-specific restriction endonuclease McrA